MDVSQLILEVVGQVRPSALSFTAVPDSALVAQAVGQKKRVSPLARL